jgi:hypothetical protein
MAMRRAHFAQERAEFDRPLGNFPKQTLAGSRSDGTDIAAGWHDVWFAAEKRTSLSQSRVHAPGAATPKEAGIKRGSLWSARRGSRNSY